MNLLHNSHFWALIALVIVILLLFKKVKGAANNFLQAKIDDIKQEIKTSEQDLAVTLSLLTDKNTDFQNLTTYLDKEVTNQKLKIESAYENLINSQKNINLSIKHSIDSYYNNELRKVDAEHNNNFVHAVESVIIESLQNNIDHNKLIDESINNISNIIK